METKVFNANEVGFKITDISQAIKAKELGMNIVDQFGDGFDYPQAYINEDGDEDERDPTEKEIMQHIAEAFTIDGQQVFATLRLSYHQILEDTATTLQSRFCVGQEVYTLENNKIKAGHIEYISLATGKTNGFYDNPEEVAKELFHLTASASLTTAYSWSSQPRKIREDILHLIENRVGENFALVRIDGNNLIKRSLSDIFATKLELAKHLMQD